MSSTYSPTLRIELIGDGDQSGIWGQTTNNNLGALIEQAITGVITITMTDANYTLAAYNGVVDEARNAVIIATGTNSAQRNIVAPLVEKTYVIKNSTTGGYAVQIIGASGSGVVIPNGVTASVYCDGTNFYPTQVNSVGNQTINGNLTVTGTTTLQSALTATTATFSGAISSLNPSFTGTPTAPTAPAGTNNTQIATTAFVANTVSTLGLGTMATQNSNNVAITGGTITGSYGLNSATSTLATKASTLSQNGGNGAAMTFNWSGQAGQPTWLWGGNDGANMYVYNPANFSVSYANSAGQATNSSNVNGGNVACSGIQVSGGAPTIWMYDSDQQDFAMHVNSNLWYILNQGGAGIMYVDQSGNFTANGNVTAFSDETIKDNWKPLDDDFLEKLVNVKSGTYDRIDLDNKRQAGVSAQDIQKILPEVVQDLEDKKLSLAYGNLAVVTCVELAKRVLALEAGVKALKGE